MLSYQNILLAPPTAQMSATAVGFLAGEEPRSTGRIYSMAENFYQIY